MAFESHFMDELRNTDPEDIDELIRQLEASFQVRFSTHDFQHVATFGELCAVVENALGKADSGGCTSQQAFHKLRQALRSQQCFAAQQMSPATQLETLFPQHNRRQSVAQLEQELGCKLGLLRPASRVSTALWLGVLGACISCWFLPKYIGIASLVVAGLALYLAYQFGKELRLSTVRELVQELATLHYACSRRYLDTINRQEVRAIVQQLFIQKLYLTPEALTPDAPIS